MGFDGLQLDKAGVELDAHGHLVLDAHLQTTNPAIFAAGDAANSLKFSHGAELHMRLLLFNFFSPIKKKLDYDHFSWVTFTDPEVAHFGLDAAELDRAARPTSAGKQTLPTTTAPWWTTTATPGCCCSWRKTGCPAPNAACWAGP
ncbi:MAG: FAD-dependent oxidoreductase [Hymenobacter sp.]